MDTKAVDNSTPNTANIAEQAAGLYREMVATEKEADTKNYNNFRLLETVKELLMQKASGLLAELDQAYRSVKAKVPISLPTKFAYSIGAGEVNYRVLYNHNETGEGTLSFLLEKAAVAEGEFLFGICGGSYRYASTEARKDASLYLDILSHFDDIYEAFNMGFCRDIVSSISKRLGEAKAVLQEETDKEASLQAAIKDNQRNQ